MTTAEHTSADTHQHELESVIADARLRPAVEQTRLVMGVADLYAARATEDEDTVRAFGHFFTRLVQAAAYEVRHSLSRRLGSADWIPRELARALANDDIEIARPVISASPLLTDGDLLDLLARASTDHRLQVALRPGLTEGVASAVLDTGEPLLLTALASNVHARLSGDGMERLVEAAAHIVGLRLPLSRHPALDETLAEQLYRWVGDSIRHSLCERFPHHAERLKRAVSDTVETLTDAHVADRLNESGRLTPPALLGLLREGRQSLFMHCLALLSGVRVSEIERLLGKPSARPFYLGCLAAGIDRATFPPLLEALRVLNGSVPPPLLESELRLGERARYQARLELRAYIDSLHATAHAH